MMEQFRRPHPRIRCVVPRNRRLADATLLTRWLFGACPRKRSNEHFLDACSDRVCCEKSAQNQDWPSLISAQSPRRPYKYQFAHIQHLHARPRRTVPLEGVVVDTVRETAYRCKVLYLAPH